MRYVKPGSLTWWAGVCSVLTGITTVALPALDALDELARLIAVLAGTGDASPAALIFLGLGLIGLRDRIERGFKGEA